MSGCWYNVYHGAECDTNYTDLYMFYESPHEELAIIYLRESWNCFYNSLKI